MVTTSGMSEKIAILHRRSAIFIGTPGPCGGQGDCFFGGDRQLEGHGAGTAPTMSSTFTPSSGSELTSDASPKANTPPSEPMSQYP